MAHDVVDLIKQDHRELERLFERIRLGNGDRALLFQEAAAVLTAHSRAEEAEVYPRLPDPDMRTHAREEHAEADELLAALKTMDPYSRQFEAGFAKLVEGVSEHIAEEESQTLPALRRALSASQRAELAEAFLQRRGEELRHGPSTRQIGGSELSRQRLYERAAAYGIPGRSHMTREELFDAVKLAESQG